MLYTTEAQIERAAESKMDRLDREYLNTPMTEEEYTKKCKEIEQWVVEQYKIYWKGVN